MCTMPGTFRHFAAMEQVEMSNATYGFTAFNVNAAPASHGVYVLYDSTGIIYIGRAAGDGVTIRSRLQSHLHGNEASEDPMVRDVRCGARARGMRGERSGRGFLRGRVRPTR